MKPVKEAQLDVLSRNVIQAFDDLSGLHPGFRPAHAKGILLSGVFTPSPGGKSLTRAPHLQRSSTPATVRFSDATGIPAIPDNDLNASPRGIAIRFHLAEHVHTDIIAHSTDGFPTRTAQEFLEFLRAAHASGPGAAKPTALESFLAAHPAALRFVQTPKPIPSSYAKESYFAVNAYKFTNHSGVARFGRFRVRPDGGSEYLSPEIAAAKPGDFLIDEIKHRIATGPTRLRITVQLAEAGDVVDDSTVQWPESRTQIDFGMLQLTAVALNNEAEQNRIIFDPIPRVEGIDSSGDPLLEPRAAIYLASGRRRRAARAK